MIQAFRLFTGDDGHSHVERGFINADVLVQVESFHVKESPPHSSWDWHPDPEPRFVLTLSGTLEFTTMTGEQFVMHPGDILVAEDDTGTGHKWRLIDEQPWKRAYVNFKKDADTQFRIE